MKRKSGSGGSPEQRRFTDALLRNVPGMAYRCLNDRPWTMIFVSDGCESITGYRKEVMLGDPSGFGWVNLIHVDDREAAKLEVDAALRARRSFDIQYRIINKLGQERWMREQGSGVYADDGTVEAIEGYIDDITPLKSAMLKLAKAEAKYEEEVRRRHERLAHADRLNTLGEMASGIAHEINQPLTAISLFAQTGKRLFEAGDFDKLPEIFDKLSRHSRRAGSIVERMQDMARPKKSVKQSVNLNSLIEEVSELAEVDAKRSNIVIELDSEVDLPNVTVDGVQIQQVTLNLLRNGMEAMRSSGSRNGNTIRLSTRHCHNGYVEVAVVDSGSGVSQEVAERLFDSFSTTKPTGLGMGLPISKAIIAAHGGQLTFRNNEISGATFCFTLPTAASRE